MRSYALALVLTCAIGGCASRASAPEDREPPRDTLPTAAQDTAAEADRPPVEAPTDSVAADSIFPTDSAAADSATRAHPPVDTLEARRPLRICAGGDVLLGNNLDRSWAERAAARLGRPVEPQPDPDTLLAPLRPLVSDADIVLINVEGAIGAGPAPRKCRPGSRRCYAFRQAPEAAAALARLGEPGVAVANVANNHALDAGLQGLRTTVRLLREAGVHVTGADTLATVVTMPDTVAFLGFATARAGPDPRDLAAVRRHVARAAARYRRVVVTVHMGAEGRGAQRTRDAGELFLGEDRGNPVAFAHAALDAGASLVVGHGPHVLRAVEWPSEGRLVLYSLGNLLTYGPFNLEPPLNVGALACADLDAAGRVRAAELRSTRQLPPGLARPDPTARAAALVDSLTRLDFPDTGGRVGPDGRLRPPAPDRRPAEDTKEKGGI